MFSLRRRHSLLRRTARGTSARTGCVHLLFISTARVDADADQARWSVWNSRGRTISSYGVIDGRPYPTTARLPWLAVCPQCELWHRGEVTLIRDETATLAAGCTAPLRDVRCPRSRAVRRHSNKNGLVCVPKRGVLRRMQVADMPHKWLYEPDEDPKRKHHWNQNNAGFVTVGAIPGVPLKIPSPGIEGCAIRS